MGRSGSAPYPEWASDARDCLQEEPVFEAIGRTDADWRVELDRDARSLMGHDLRREARWPAACALEGSIKNRRMLISPTHPVRGGDTGFAVFFPCFRERTSRVFWSVPASEEIDP